MKSAAPYARAEENARRIPGFITPNIRLLRSSLKVHLEILSVHFRYSDDMTVEWALGGPDILLTLDRSAGPMRIRSRISCGRRFGRNGSAPESVCRRLDVLPNTSVSRAARSSTYRSSCWPKATSSRRSAPGRGLPRASRMARSQAALDVAIPASPSSLKPPEVTSVRHPHLGSVPLTAWSWALSEATDLPTAELGDEEQAGSRHLREVVTAYHRRARLGCAVAEDAVIVSGFARGWVSSSRRWHSAASSRSRWKIPGPATRRHCPPFGSGRCASSRRDHGLDVDRLRKTGPEPCW